MFRKNVAGQFIHFQGVDATTGGIKSGVSWTARRCIDGTFAAAGGTATEDGTTGWYKFALTQADTNGNNIGFNFTGTGAVPQTVNIVTTACDPTAATNFGITGIPAIATGSAGALLVDGTGTAAISNSAGKVLLQATQSGVTIPTVTTVTNQLTAAAVATGVWQDTTAGDFTTAASIGKSIMNGVALGTGLTINAYTGNTAQTGDSFARIGATGSGLTSITGVLPAALTAGGHIKADSLALDGSTGAATNLKTGATGLVVSTCAAGSSTTSIITNLTEATDSHYNGRIITFTGGALAGQSSDITAYNGTSKTLTVTALTEAPVSTDPFVIS